MMIYGEVRTNEMAQAHAKLLLVEFNRRPTWVTQRNDVVPAKLAAYESSLQPLLDSRNCSDQIQVSVSN
jgi:hypothetical protein